MSSYFTAHELARLRQLRETLLSIEDRGAGEEAPRYWSDVEDIELYDRVFAARIGWKWGAVLDEVEERGGLPELSQEDTLVDWATGTGVAARVVLARMTSRPGRVVLFDRDESVLEYARASIAGAFPEVEFETTSEPPNERARVLLVSHVLDELDEHGASILRGAVRNAECALWVEPGSKRTSRRLSESRDELIRTHRVVAPCTHRTRCGILAAGKERDWCHFFAKPPAEVHTEGAWAEIGRELRIDLRSLPYSFLALRAARSDDANRAAHDPTLRRIGRARLQRGRALVDLCGKAGVEETQLLQRNHKALFKELKKNPEAARWMRATPEGVAEITSHSRH